MSKLKQIDTFIEKIITESLEDIVSERFARYSKYIIQDRALPDVRDGLKPVQRRILYAMHEMGLRPQSRFRKSAGIVGEVLKLYHPHSDSRSEEHTSELQSRPHLVCRLLLEKKNKNTTQH